MNVLDFDSFTNKIDEGLIKTYPIFKTVSYIQNKLGINGETIDVINPGENDEFIAVDGTAKEELLKRIDDMLNCCGYIKEYSSDGIFCYAKKITDDIFDKMKSLGIKYLYHFTPSINDEKIKSQGLVPKNKNEKYTYPPRIYLLPDTEVKENKIFFRNFCEHLYSTSSKNLNNKMSTRRVVKYSVYKIDFNKMRGIKIYESANTKNYRGYYTTECIRPEFMKKIFEINIY